MSHAPESRHDRRPPYQHAADELRRDILQGRIKPGEQVPPVRLLTERFHLASMTIRNALDVLRDEGLIYTVHGRGSYVTDRAEPEAESPDQIGEYTIDFTPPAWWQQQQEAAEREAGAEGAIVHGDTEAAGSADLIKVLTALRDEVRHLSAQHQELRREIEALKAERGQGPES
ncbi:GntR family transcriptional regulator [Streptomyces sp. NBC_00838]|uniref:GntR family transcriptional regulator n=1 Tax=Streptomyces sp. NBC_00838 TaxID=2903680 RepID=UPI003868924C|nr:GntR family transcriptional regulator [Streptomyces sp. NBC_00838]